MIDRRAAIGFGAATVADLVARAAAEPPARAPDSNEAIALWPGVPPGGSAVNRSLKISEQGAAPSGHRDRIATDIGRPTLTVLRPAQPDGSALLIAPGGGYLHIAIDREGFEPAHRFNEAGVTTFVLLYRLPGEGWTNRANVPLEDAQRAMRVIRANTARFGIDPARLGVLGFSAGGHLAASLATRFAAQVYDPIDAADTMDPRPSFAAMLYPVITMLKPNAHEASREHLLGPYPPDDQRMAYSCERLVSAETPPCFLAASQDDPDVPVENSLAMFASLRANHVPAEMHVFEEGGHGYGTGDTGTPAAAWPDLLLRWGERHGYFRNAAAKV